MINSVQVSSSIAKTIMLYMIDRPVLFTVIITSILASMCFLTIDILHVNGGQKHG